MYQRREQNQLDKEYVSLMFESMDMSVFRRVTKDLHLRGFRTGKAPKSIVSSMFFQGSEQSRRRMLTDIYKDYFPDRNLESFELEEDFDEECIAGIMAACALTGRESQFMDAYRIRFTSNEQDDNVMAALDSAPSSQGLVSLEKEKELEIDPSETHIHTISVDGTHITTSNDEEVGVHDNMIRDDRRINGLQSLKEQKGEDAVVKYLGYISVIENYRRSFYNFFPVAIINSDESITRLSKEEMRDLFPERGNIFIKSGWDDTQIEETFKRGKLYILDIVGSMLEDNLKNDRELNITNKRVPLSTLINANAIHPASEINLFPLIDEPNYEEMLREGLPISISAYFGADFDNEMIMLRNHDKLVGPFPIVESADGNYHVQTQAKRRNYVFDVYTSTDPSINYYTGSDIAKYEPDAVTYVDLRTLMHRQEDFISEETLLQELKRIIASSS